MAFLLVSDLLNELRVCFLSQTFVAVKTRKAYERKLNIQNIQLAKDHFNSQIYDWFGTRVQVSRAAQRPILQD